LGVVVRAAHQDGKLAAGMNVVDLNFG